MSSQPKSQQAKQAGRPQPRAAAAKQALPQVTVTAELVSRAKKEVAKMKYVTPYRLSVALSINMSVARKLMRQLIRDGDLVPLIKNRRLTVAVPAAQKSK